VPLSINGILSSILSAVSALILPRRLVAACFSYSQALSEIGKFGGMALNIVTLPYIIIGSMLTVLVPELSLNISKKDYWSAEERIAQVLKMAITVGIATSLVCLRIPDILGELFYNRHDLGDMVRFSSPICLILFVSSPTFGILNALGKQNILLKNSLINSLQSLVLTYILAGMPALNIYGYGISAVITAVTSFILNIREIQKICEIKIGLQDVVTYLLTGAAVWLASVIVGGLLSQAPAVVTTAGVVIVCFAGMFSLNGLAFKFRTEP
jgi:stage V sporulation protein B